MTRLIEYANIDYSQLPDLIQDFFRSEFDKAPGAKVLAFLKHELMHAIWRLLLDEDFVHAYTYGIVIQCADGIWRRVFPRFLCYSADYPEKYVSFLTGAQVPQLTVSRVLLVGLKYLAQYLCPRCLVTEDQVPELGLKCDMVRHTKQERKDSTIVQRMVDNARRLIFACGYAVGGKAVSEGLKYSITATKVCLSFTMFKPLTCLKNAFSQLLLPRGRNYYSMFPVDILHDFEVGKWKDIFVHLIRILYAYGGGAVADLDAR